jgi:hypothetical protein
LRGQATPAVVHENLEWGPDVLRGCRTRPLCQVTGHWPCSPCTTLFPTPSPPHPLVHYPSSSPRSRDIQGIMSPCLRLCRYAGAAMTSRPPTASTASQEDDTRRSASADSDDDGGASSALSETEDDGDESRYVVTCEIVCVCLKRATIRLPMHGLPIHDTWLCGHSPVWKKRHHSRRV